MALDTNSKHIDFTKSKSLNRLGNPSTRLSRQAKKDAYFMRCYYGYKECIEQDGQVFFYTLTYTQKKLPHFYGIPCFSYEDISWMMKSNGFAKSLQRNYGTALKYAVFCEYGDENSRPHYHLLFYLFPFRNKKGELSKKYPYKKIDPIDFKSLVKHYWQGDMFRYEESIKGIVKEGSLNHGLVKDFKAIQYCTKYVIKSQANEHAELKIMQNIRSQVTNQLINDKHTWVKFIANIINSYKSPIEAIEYKKHFKESPNELLRRLHRSWYERSKNNSIEEMSLDHVINARSRDFMLYLLTDPFIKVELEDKFKSYCRLHSHSTAEELYKEYLYHYGPRPRLSHGLGLSVLNDIDPYNPTIKLPSRNKWREVPISLYYYRKLFKEVVKDENTNFKVKYIDNNLAIEVKKAKLNDRITKTANNLRNTAIKYNAAKATTKEQIQYNYVRISPNHINTYASIADLFTDSGTNLATPYLMNENVEDPHNIWHQMATYTEVYRDRYCKLDEHGNYPQLDLVKDYDNFLYPEYYYINYSEPELAKKENYSDETIDLYDNHPAFQHFQKLLEFIEKVDDKLTELKDIEDDEKEEYQNTLKKFHRLGKNFGVYDLLSEKA